ncbi:MAG: PqqD family protein [Bacteroidales bacterium]|jgi:hypothetical protein
MTYFKIKTPNVVYETYENEVVLINLDNGNYYSISGSAADIFNLVLQDGSKTGILKGIISKYEGNNMEIVSSLEKFLEHLLDEGLIIRDEKELDAIPQQEKETIQKNSNLEKSHFESPVLNRYTDMQDLLLLDPVHEVDESGWPNPKPPDPDLDVQE